MENEADLEKWPAARIRKESTAATVSGGSSGRRTWKGAVERGDGVGTGVGSWEGRFEGFGGRWFWGFGAAALAEEREEGVGLALCLSGGGGGGGGMWSRGGVAET